MQITGAEEDPVKTLVAIVPVDEDTARRVLLKHNGDANRAAMALLGGDKGEQEYPPRQNTPEPGAYYETPNTVPPIQVTPAPTGSLIDLTGDTDPYQTIPASSFGPSNRAPDPAWQMVPSNLAVSSTPGISHDDQTLNEAIQASLNDFATEENGAFPIIHNVREGGRPVAIRPESPSLACAALVVQALYYVPQIRAAVGQLRLPDIGADSPYNHPARAVWNLIELFTNMDLAQLATIVDVEVLPSLESEHDRERTADHPSNRAAAMLDNLGPTLEAHLSGQRDDDDSATYLFEFTHANVELINRLPRKVGRKLKGGVVRIEIPGATNGNDLVSKLGSMLSSYEEGKSSHDVIVEPSSMIGFSIGRQRLASNQQKQDATPFSYPKSFFLDRFLFRNLELTNRKRAMEQEYQWEIQDLTNQRETLTKLNQRDNIQDLRNTIHYYENVADAKGDPARSLVLKSTVIQLKDVLAMVESKVEGLDQRIRELETLSENLFNDPELQKFQYDLRAVLVHTGLPGRKQMYSYVEDNEGIWWKTCDYEVTEVTEEAVLNDTTGLHLAAGPFLLMYSMHLSDEELRRPIIWPRIFAEPTEDNNKKFLAMLPPEIASKAKRRRSLPPPLAPRSLTPSRSVQYPQPLRSGSMGPRAANRPSPKVPETTNVMSVD